MNGFFIVNLISGSDAWNSRNLITYNRADISSVSSMKFEIQRFTNEGEKQFKISIIGPIPGSYDRQSKTLICCNRAGVRILSSHELSNP